MFIQVMLLIMGIWVMLVTFRIIKGPTVWDRLLGLNMLSAKIVMMIVLYGVFAKDSSLLDIALVYALLGFIGILFIANFIQKKGKI